MKLSQAMFPVLGLVSGLAFCSASMAETIRLPLHDIAGLRLHNTEVRVVDFKGRRGLEVAVSAESQAELAELRRQQARSEQQQTPPVRLDHLVVVTDHFHDGTIELELAGQPAPGAAGGARGFVGIAFRIQEALETYECIYLRPTNGRAADQERRNHSVQYVSHPDYPWHRLRRETPSRYESYVDLEPAEWIDVKIVVAGSTARLFVHGNEQPTLIVSDLKLGADASGPVALWIEGSTIAHFRNLRVTR